MGVPGFQGNDGVPVSKAKSNHHKSPSLTSYYSFMNVP